ncbi:MAG: D-proline reductase (dithiol) protein PrdB, partial [Chloroflexi bacterium]|nr:D-proline reductase (dithiol) protein PrdB [Chloroflexota bacterium]
LPIDRLRELRDEGVIGSLSPSAYSFVGAASQLRLLKESGPQLAERLIDQEVDATLLVAA